MSGYSQVTMEDLVKDNPFFMKSAEERYNIFKYVDPFPNISASLLNSVDIIKYVMTTGMMEPFNINNLSGATYDCEISGEYTFWDENKVYNKGFLNNDTPELKISPNSIIFIAVKQFFRIPSYMVLRFNLRVPHVHKGLLLGTGPIVDPCFEGQLYIPLHNLTSNSYIIKKNALLIDIEFTKMSKNSFWNITPKSKQKKIVDAINFNGIKYNSPIFKPGRSFPEYINDALSKDPLFFKYEPDKININSSLPEEITAFKKTIDVSEAKIKERFENIEKLENDVKGTQRFVNVLMFFSVISILVAAIAVFSSAILYFSNSNKLNDAIKINETQQEMFSYAQKKYDTDSINFIKRIDDLEKKLEAISTK